jgi:predicted phosphodiesterase
MNIGIISDIHGNYEALKVVLAELDRMKVSDVICLGDIVGMGPNSRECLQKCMNRCKQFVLGDQEAMLWEDRPSFLSKAFVENIRRTRRSVERSFAEVEDADSYWEFLWSLPRSFEAGDILFVHGSPREPTYEYVFPEDQYNQRKVDSLFQFPQRWCFLGHTHLPGVLRSDYRFLVPADFGHEYFLGEDKAIVNVGSVGQSRDGDPRACYVLLDDRRVIFRRIEYDMEQTRKKLRGRE